MKTNPALGQVESKNLEDFARVMQKCTPKDSEASLVPGRINLDPDNPKNGLAQLVLTLVKLLHELLERQGIRRMEADSLTEEEIERLGLTLMKQAREIDRLRREFGLAEEDLNLNLGPLGKLL
jgi:hypothetical protein